LKFISAPIAYVNSWQPNWIDPWPDDAGVHRARQGKARPSHRRYGRNVVIAKWIGERAYRSANKFFANAPTFCDLVILSVVKMCRQRRMGNRVSANHYKIV